MTTFVTWYWLAPCEGSVLNCWYVVVLSNGATIMVAVGRWAVPASQASAILVNNDLYYFRWFVLAPWPVAAATMSASLHRQTAQWWIPPARRGSLEIVLDRIVKYFWTYIEIFFWMLSSWWTDTDLPWLAASCVQWEGNCCVGGGGG